MAGRRGRQPLPRRRLLAVGDHVRPPDARDRRRDPGPARPAGPRHLPRRDPRAGHRAGRAAARAGPDRRRPGLGKVFFAGDGSSAVEVALKMAYQASVQSGRGRGRSSCTCAEAYHGDTLGAVSVGGIDLFHATYRPLLLRTLAVGSPGLRGPGQSPAERAAEVLAELEALLAERGERGLRDRGRADGAGGGRDAHLRRRVPARRAPPGHRARRAAHLRRGRHRHRPHRPDVGQRARRRRAGPADLRQGPDRRVPAAVGRAGHRRGVRGVPRLGRVGPHLLPWPHLHGQPAVLRGGQRQPRPRGVAGPGRRGRPRWGSGSATLLAPLADDDRRGRGPAASAR